MEKAYDLKALGDGLKEDGLDLGEEGAKKVFERVCSWFEASAKLSSNPFDDMVLGVLPKIKEEVHKKLDLIDGKIEG